MTSRDTRLGQLSDNLTAQERALLVLRSWKEGRDEDPRWRWRMPAGQINEFNRLIELMNGVNVHLVPLLVVLGLEAEKLLLRLGILGVLAVWYVQAEDAAWVLEMEGKRPELDLELERLRPRLPVVYVREELREAVAEATEGVEPTKIDEAAAALKDCVREELQCHRRYLVAAEAALADVEREFGEDPAVPRTRQALDHARGEMARAREEAERFLGPLEDEEAGDELLSKARRLVGLDG